MIATLRRWWFNFTSVVTLAMLAAVCMWLAYGAFALVYVVLDMTR